MLGGIDGCGEMGVQQPGTARRGHGTTGVSSILKTLAVLQAWHHACMRRALRVTCQAASRRPRQSATALHHQVLLAMCAYPHVHSTRRVTALASHGPCQHAPLPNFSQGRLQQMVETCSQSLPFSNRTQQEDGAACSAPGDTPTASLPTSRNSFCRSSTGAPGASRGTSTGRPRKAASCLRQRCCSGDSAGCSCCLVHWLGLSAAALSALGVPRVLALLRSEALARCMQPK